MTNQLIYTLAITLLLGFQIKDSNKNFIIKETYNNSFASSIFENKIEQDTTPSYSRSKTTYKSNDNGQKIHLVIIDGEIKKFKINGRRIPKKEYNQYDDLITEIKSGTETPIPPTPPTPPSPPNHESTSEVIAQSLIEDGLITNENRYKIHLSKKKLKVNGKTQDKSTHQKYLNLYKELSGNEMDSNSTYRVNKNDF